MDGVHGGGVAHGGDDDDLQAHLFGFIGQIDHVERPAGDRAADQHVARAHAGLLQRVGGQALHVGVQVAAVALAHRVVHRQVVLELLVEDQAAAAVDQLPVDDVAGVTDVHAAAVRHALGHNLTCLDHVLALGRAHAVIQRVDFLPIPVHQHGQYPPNQCPI